MGAAWAGVDPKSLLEAIGNALYQECLIWRYEIREANDGRGKANYNLHVVLADPEATELAIETLEDVEASALLFRSRTAPSALVQICCRTQADLSGNEETREVGELTLVPQARLVDLFLDAFEGCLALPVNDGSSSVEPESPTLKSSTVSIGPYNTRRGQEG
jgi:hypothetical protein